MAYDAAGNESNASNSINVTTNSSSGAVVLHEGYFESGWDGWQDGGSDCKRYSGIYSSEGSFSIRIRDNSNTASAMTSPTFDISSFSTIDIDFNFYPRSMENNEDFWVRYYDGSSWQTIATFTRGVDFNNNIYYIANVSISSIDYNFPSNAQFRFQCDASGNNDQIYVDAVILTADAGSGGALIASNTLEVITLENQYHEEEEIIDAAVENEVEAESDFALTPISVFPNPANDFINIDLRSIDAEIIQMGVFDVMGREVMNIASDNIDGIMQKDVSQLTSGMYFLRVMNIEKETQMIKFYVK